MSMPTDDPVRRAVATLAAAGHGPTRIAAEIHRTLGVRVHRKTVSTWLDPKIADRRRERDRRAKRAANAARTGGAIGGVQHSPELKLERMRWLRARNVPVQNIVLLMRLDWPGDNLTAAEVEESLSTGSYVPFERMSAPAPRWGAQAA